MASRALAQQTAASAPAEGSGSGRFPASGIRACDRQLARVAVRWHVRLSLPAADLAEVTADIADAPVVRYLGTDQLA
jgi:hypothetical protein